MRKGRKELIKERREKNGNKDQRKGGKEKNMYERRIKVGRKEKE